MPPLDRIHTFAIPNQIGERWLENKTGVRANAPHPGWKALE